jgi:RHH-type transcriptional regulator, rel operon repressor / antitoxin RelB
MTRVSPEIKRKLRALAKETDRSESYLAAEAIAAYVDLNAWQVARIKKSLAEVTAGDPGVTHDRVAAWLDSWGSEGELPPPKLSKAR